MLHVSPDATEIARLDSFESELLLRIVRVLIRDHPAAIGQLIRCCKTLAELASMHSEEGEEMRKARRAVARQRLFDLRVCAGQTPAPLVPLVGQVSRRLSFKAMDPIVDEPLEFDIGRWSRTVRPNHDDHERGTAVAAS